MKKVITANQAAGWGAYLAKTQVVAAYPITPQTSIIETLAGLMLKANWKHRFMNVESEHSVMAASIAASLAGARVFTATSSQGLLLMHELLHWAGAGRVPVVMVNVNRAIAPGWNIWSDQQDSLSQRDTGWIQIYSASAQEVLDSVIMGFKLAETLHIPVMIVLDAFYLSHTAEAVDIPDIGQVERFLGPRAPLFKIQPGGRETFGAFQRGEPYQKMRHQLALDFEKTELELDAINADFAKIFGRQYGAVETYAMEDARIALVVSGTPSSTARIAVDKLRERGLRAGIARARLFRPFPTASLRKTLSGTDKVAVLDRNFSWGARGIFFQELQSALYSLDAGNRPRLYGYVYGLGGTDITPSVIEEAIRLTDERDRPDPEVVWLGQKREEFVASQPQEAAR